MKSIVVFLIIALVLFVFDISRPEGEVVVDSALKAHISGLWQTQMGRQPSDAELISLIDNWIREEIFYREALRLGLDQDDAILRRRLVQKLSFLKQEIDEIEIGAEDVVKHYQENISLYSQPARFSFSQILYQDNSRSQALLTDLQTGGDWQVLGEPTLLPKVFIRKSKREITSALGLSFGHQLEELDRDLAGNGEWLGPLESGYGFHLIRLDNYLPPAPIPFSDIEARVTADLIQQKRDRALEDYFQELKTRYQVRYE